MGLILENLYDWASCVCHVSLFVAAGNNLSLHCLLIENS